MIMTMNEIKRWTAKPKTARPSLGVGCKRTDHVTGLADQLVLNLLTIINRTERTFGTEIRMKSEIWLEATSRLG